MLDRMIVCLFSLAVISPGAPAGMPDLAVTVVRRLPGNLSPEQTREHIRRLPPCMPILKRARDEQAPSQATSVRMAYDTTHFYVYCICREERMDAVRAQHTEHDSPAHRDDAIELLIDTTHDRKTYFHAVGSVSGGRFDERDKPGIPESWDGPWSTEVERQADSWSILMVLPFSSLETTAPAPGTRWGCQIRRNERPSREETQWAPTGAPLHRPELFGDLLFVPEDGPMVTTDLIGLYAPHRNPIPLSVSVPSGTRELELTVQAGGNTVASFTHQAGPGETSWTPELDAPDADRLTLAVKDLQTGWILFQTHIRVSVPDHRASLRELASRAAGTEPATEEGHRLKDGLSSAIASAEAGFAPHTPDTPDRWAAFGGILGTLQADLVRLQCTCADREEAGYVAGVESPLRKVFRDQPYSARLDTGAEVSLARNEYEPVQAVLYAYDRPLENIRVSVSDLKGPEGAVLGAGEIELHRVGYVLTRTPRYLPITTGWHPDPLMDLEPFSLAQGEIQPIWITVHAPGQAIPGIYEGEIRVQPTDAPETRLPLRVHVRDFTLPRTVHLKTAFSFSEERVNRWYGAFTGEMRKEYYEFLLKRHINPSNIYRGSTQPGLEDVAFCVERGLNSMNLAHTPEMDEEKWAEYIRMITAGRDYLREHGWWDLAYIYGFDEVGPPNYPKLKEVYGRVRQEFPDLPRMCTVIPNEDLKGYVDIWVPLTANFDPETAAEYTRAGDQVWWYVCCVPERPHVNFFIDYPATDPRLLPWMNWKYRVPGLLYYAINMWASNMMADNLPSELTAHDDPGALEAIRAGRRWPEVPWNTFTWGSINGDGQLIYPGPDGRPISSIRLECIRDGIDDYEYFHILQDRLEKAETSQPGIDPQLLVRARELLAVSPAVVRSTTEYTGDPEVILRERAAIADAIEQLGPGL